MLGQLLPIRTTGGTQSTFLHVPPIKGESLRDGHHDEIEVVSLAAD